MPEEDPPLRESAPCAELSSTTSKAEGRDTSGPPAGWVSGSGAVPLLLLGDAAVGAWVTSTCMHEIQAFKEVNPRKWTWREGDHKVVPASQVLCRAFHVCVLLP